MKRWLGVLAILLLFSGCSNAAPQEEDDSTPEALPQIPSLMAPALYDSTNPIEAFTGGAVKAYTPEDGTCLYVAPMGRNFLLFTKNGVTLYRGERLAEVASVEIPDIPLPGSGMLQVRDDGIAYYDVKEKQIVFLNQYLRAVGVFSLPKEISGDVYLSADWKMFYYCSDAGVHALDLDTGVSRLLKAQNAQWQGVNGGFANSAVLRCIFKDDAAERTMLLSAETGTVLAEGDYLNNMCGTGAGYYLSSGGEHIFGYGQEQSVKLTLMEKGRLYPLPDEQGAVVLAKSKISCRLDYYDIKTGQKAASVKLTGITKVDGIFIANGDVFFTVGDILYRWDPQKSLTEDPEIYTQPYYHYADPDEEGLAAVGQQIQQLEESYGVNILYWNEVEALAPWDYHFTAEYLTQPYTENLSRLEQALAKFPEGFFDEASKWTKSGKLNILLVRGIYGGVQTEKYASASGIQFNANGDTYIALTVGEDMENWFYHELGHLLDNRILSTTNSYSNWSALNPWDFQYDNDYTKNQDRTDRKYLEGDKRYFVDFYSMSFAVEDRSRIFEYACMPGNEEVFASEPMQKKLKTVCAGIRKAFELEGESYIWEQYLQ